jgi:hypothetical protein
VPLTSAPKLVSYSLLGGLLHGPGHWDQQLVDI